METRQMKQNPGQQGDLPFTGESVLNRQTEMLPQELEDKLNQTRRLESIGQLAAGIAHEINTPIQYIGDNIQFLKDSFKDIELLLQGYSILLKEAKADSISESTISDIENIKGDTDSDYIIEEIPKAIDQSLEGVRHVSKIVTGMKQFCHPGIEEKIETDLNTSIKNIITVARNEWKYVADIVTDFDPTLPPVPCIQGEISQVILNLIINAAHAIKDVVAQRAGEKGSIRVSTSYDDSWAEVRISDSGTGIPETVRSRIFDPFFTTKEVGKGTGQGLAISHAVVVKTHGGSLDFETEIGKGTTMIVRLPLRVDNEQ